MDNPEVFAIITQNENYINLLNKKFEKGLMSEEVKTTVEMIVSIKEEKKLSLDEISMNLKIKRPRLSKLIKEAGFIWDKKNRSYSKMSVSNRIDLQKKKVRKKVIINLEQSTSKILDFILEQRKCNEEDLFKNLIEECVQSMPFNEVIDIVSS